MPCRFADALGTPGEGFHRPQLGHVAAGDFLLTLVVSVGLAYIPGSPPLVVWLILLLLIAITLHAAFCTKTSVNEWLYASSARAWVSAAVLVTAAILILALRTHAQQGVTEGANRNYRKLARKT